MEHAALNGHGAGSTRVGIENNRQLVVLSALDDDITGVSTDRPLDCSLDSTRL